MSFRTQDLRIVFRRLRKRPGFTASVILILALGLGATIALFSVVHAVLLEPLPYPMADRIYRLQEFERATGDRQEGVAVPTLRDWRSGLQSFSRLAAFRFDDFNLTGTEAPEQLRAALVDREFFDVFGPELTVGRAFSDDEVSGTGAPVVLLGHGLWLRQFGGDPEVLGTVIGLDGQEHTVVGVLPASFAMPSWADIWMPLGELRGDNRERRSVTVYGRLAEGTDRDTAEIELDTMARRLTQDHPATHEGLGLAAVPLIEEEVGEVRTTLLMLFGAVAGVLLIVCLNVAGLQLARGLERRRELALRSALGAGRRRVVGEMLSESLILALVGGGAGVLLAQWGLDIMLALAPSGIPRLDEVRLDAPVLAFALGATLVTGLLAGWLPALAATRFRLDEAIKQRDARTGGRAGSRLRGSLVVAQVALTVVLLASAGLLLGSLQRLLAVDPGYDAERMLSVGLVLPPNLYPQDSQKVAWVDTVVERLEALPEIEGAAVANSMPWSGVPGYPMGVKTRRASDASSVFEGQATEKVVSEGYFETLGIPLLAGRELALDDRRTAVRETVAEGESSAAPSLEPVLVNEALARRAWPDGSDSPIGELLELQAPGREPFLAEVIGVVADVAFIDPSSVVEPQIFRSYAVNTWPYFNIAVRSSGVEPSALVQTVRKTIWELDPDRPLFAELTAPASLESWLQRPRFGALLLTSFAGVALLLAAIGLYALMAFLVSQRTREIGIRMALGAQRDRVRWLVARQGMVLVLLGFAVGLPAALGATQLLEGMLFGIEPGDPVVFAIALVSLLVAGWLAILTPATRASRIEPVIALRED